LTNLHAFVAARTIGSAGMMPRQLDRKQRNDKMGGQPHRRKASCWTILVGTSLCLLAQVHFLLLLWSGLFIPSTDTARSRRVEGRQAPIAVADAPTDKTKNATNAAPQGLFPDGKLNVLEPLWPGRCVSFRFRGREDLFSLKEASQLLREGPAITGRPLRIGIHLAEDATKFLPVRIRESGNVYHMFHFVEFLVMAFAAMATLRGYPAAASDESWTSATQISVPWLFSPHASRKELCGGPSNINCIIADLVFRSSTSDSFQDHSAVIGLDEMDSFTFDAMNPKHKGIEQRINAARTAYDGDSRFAWADGMIKIERFGCNNGGINKPWNVFIDSFPATLWHNSIRSGLPATLDHELSPTRLVACYVDRQNTDRKLPDEHHSWLVETLQSHASVSFVQLHMEEYSALEQIQKASRCDLMVGMHGNGLTHSLWMKPGVILSSSFGSITSSTIMRLPHSC
jgi:hypothetical protein